jgi:AbiTii-like protein
MPRSYTSRVSLLEDIQASAVDPSHPLSDLLRECQILAFRLRHEPFKTWVAHELNGYPDEASLPVYRASLRGHIKADIAGGYGRSATNVAVPLSNIPPEVRDEVTQFKFYQGVATLESLVADGKRTNDTRVMSPFDPELAAVTPVWQGYQTISMWLEVPLASVQGILDQVRTRALAFTLEIEAANPNAGAVVSDGEPPVPLAQTSYIFNTTILGGQVAVGPNAAVNITQGDLPGLLRYLEGIGVLAADREALVQAIQGDAEEAEKPGSRVRDWLGRMAFKVVAVGEAVGENAAGGLIAAAVARYLGLI